ncbi:ribbon-helix-helix protein, CopG family [Halorubrum yunnanense]|uniref:Ribbon-helix-helix protein, CopG family n=1 Tax=Halorubrum yunnanense TaxID=1526162 RepID=A0ABD5YJU0_9EURY|nr:ribbon-helix-helix protein, CopG family [Halorubrum yunnanense]
MGISMSITLPEDVVDEIDNEAGNLGMSRSEYVRKHLHAGRRLFQSSGKLDRKMLQQLVEDDEAAALQDDLTTDAEGTEDEILAILPTDKNRAATKDELRTEIFGTTKEQKNRLSEALDYLEERDQISYTVNNNGEPVIYKND